ncbi:uncharacterized protein LOC108163334 [Drosophila miranda]|uniref:uncharacterized protein LOC108163334 n=1 Tax=Drosophila miranda TaxID=7229 RepID=UPI00143F3240|nr:uncharacterized protein LOC108163334 [Drosophila miranda]
MRQQKVGVLCGICGNTLSFQKRELSVTRTKIVSSERGSTGLLEDIGTYFTTIVLVAQLRHDAAGRCPRVHLRLDLQGHLLDILWHLLLPKGLPAILHNYWVYYTGDYTQHKKPRPNGIIEAGRRPPVDDVKRRQQYQRLCQGHHQVT